MKLIPIRDKNLRLDGGAMFGVVPKVMWHKQYPADDNGLCNWALRCLLVDTGNRRILIDNGVGDKQDDKFFKHYYLNGEFSLKQSLSEAGYSFGDITDVVLTHLHFDHCGGSIKYNNEGTKLEPCFPNAEYWISKRQWEWALNPNDREKASFLKENILPIKETGRLQLVEDEDCMPIPEIRFVQFHGHTDGQIIPHINYKGKTVVFMADLLPSTVHIPMPWIMGYDTRPLLTLEDKERFYTEALKNDYILFFEHDIYHECCNLRMTEKGVRPKDTFTLKEYFQN